MNVAKGRNSEQSTGKFIRVGKIYNFINRQTLQKINLLLDSQVKILKFLKTHD